MQEKSGVGGQGGIGAVGGGNDKQGMAKKLEAEESAGVEVAGAGRKFLKANGSG